jgi:hypothetical protein
MTRGSNVIRFQVAAGAPPSPATAEYRRDDYTLVVGPEGKVPASTARASICTTTLLFSSDEHRLVGLDAYTNPRRWDRRRLDLPAANQQRSVECVEPFDVHGIAKVDSGTARYMYSDTNSLLRIQIEEHEVVRLVRCLSCATCGLGSMGELVELWVQGVKP